MQIKSEKVKAAIRSMPPLSHWPDKSVEFDVTKSPMMQWVAQQPEVMAWLYDAIRETGELTAFNPETGLWAGLDHNSQEPKA